MQSNTPVSIRLMIDRREQTIMINTIIYAQITDKLCTIYLTNHAPLKLFLSISALENMLPASLFLEISRSCLVALPFIRTIEETNVVMSNGSRLPYSSRRKNIIHRTYQHYLAQQAASQNSKIWEMNLSAEFQCFDRCPVPFFILENVSNPLGSSIDFLFRYANEAFAYLIEHPLHHLINHSLSMKFPSYADQWIPVLSNVALHGEDQKFTHNHPKSQSDMLVTFYQPHYGFCACLLTTPIS